MELRLEERVESRPETVEGQDVVITLLMYSVSLRSSEKAWGKFISSNEPFPVAIVDVQYTSCDANPDATKRYTYTEEGSCIVYCYDLATPPKGLPRTHSQVKRWQP